jgi:hypothetical protein
MFQKKQNKIGEQICSLTRGYMRRWSLTAKGEHERTYYFEKGKELFCILIIVRVQTLDRMQGLETKSGFYSMEI